MVKVKVDHERCPRRFDPTRESVTSPIRPGDDVKIGKKVWHVCKIREDGLIEIVRKPNERRTVKNSDVVKHITVKYLKNLRLRNGTIDGRYYLKSCEVPKNYVR